MAKLDPNKLYVATHTFLSNAGNATEGVTVLWGDDPMVRSHPDFFKLSPINRPDVEDATQAPGSKRGK